MYVGAETRATCGWEACGGSNHFKEAQRSQGTRWPAKSASGFPKQDTSPTIRKLRIGWLRG